MSACCVSNTLVVDIINVVSVVKGVKVEQWIESDDNTLKHLYWRQALNCTTFELSVCNCYNSSFILGRIGTDIFPNSRSLSTASVGPPRIPTRS